MIGLQIRNKSFTSDLIRFEMTQAAQPTVHDVTALLDAAQSADASARQQAEAGLKELETSPASYLLSLSFHLAGENNSIDTRRLSGVLIERGVHVIFDIDHFVSCLVGHHFPTSDSNCFCAGLILKNTLDAKDQSKKVYILLFLSCFPCFFSE